MIVWICQYGKLKDIDRGDHGYLILFSSKSENTTSSYKKYDIRQNFLWKMSYISGLQ